MFNVWCKIQSIMKTIDLDDLITQKQAAELLGVTRWTIRNYVKAGKIGFVKVGKLRLFVGADIMSMKLEREING